MKTYNKYKKIDFDWINMIPEDWEIVHLKRIATYEKGKNAAKYTNEYVKTNKGLYPVYSGQTENEGIMGFINSYEYDCDGIITTTVGAKAMTNRIVSGKFSLSQNCCVIKSETTNSMYFKYLLDVLFSSERAKIPSHMQPSLRFGDLDKYQLIVPSKETQNNIANALSKIDSVINSFISQKESYIRLIKEYKQSRIYELLTKGIIKNPVLKDSGEQWLGKVPEQWELKKIQYLFRVVKEIAKEDGHDVLSITQEGIKIKDISKNEGQLSSDYSKYQKVKKGDFAMNHMDLLTGFVDISKYDGVTSPDYRVFQLTDTKSDPEYMLYLFQMCYARKIFYPLGRGASQLGRWRLGIEAFRSFLLPVPQLKEQNEIVSVIKKESNVIDSLITKAEKQIGLIQQYRQSLIYELVTGRRKP